MKSMFQLVEGFLNTNGKTTFDDIFEYVSKDKWDLWVEKSPKMTEKKIKLRKIAELNLLLTVEGIFTKVSDTEWATTKKLKYQEIQSSKIKIQTI